MTGAVVAFPPIHRSEPPHSDQETQPFAELVAATNFSFLDGASHAEDMVSRAVALKLAGIGIADRNTVAGVVRAHKALKKARLGLIGQHLPPLDFKLIVGARLVFVDGTPDIVAYPATRRGWGRLTRLLTLGNRRAEKGSCRLNFDDLVEHCQDLMLVVLPTSSNRETSSHTERIIHKTEIVLADTLVALQKQAPHRVWLGVSMFYGGADRRCLTHLERLADRTRVPLLATCDALYAEPADRDLHDIVTCIREGVPIGQAGRLLAANGERHIKDHAEMVRLFRDRPDAVTNTVEFLSRIDFTLDQLRYEYPHEPVPPGWHPQDWLEHLAWQSAIDHYDCYVPDKVLASLREEFALIRDREYAYYFLTVHDVVRFARSCDPPILCQGRGSAANSVVCYVLKVTSVDPMRHDLLFSRFVSSERHEPPDIDIDFEHERREEVMQYIYRRYSRERAGIVSTVIHYRPRSAVREVGKVLGLSEDVTQRLTSTVWGSFSDSFGDERFQDSGYDLTNPDMARLQSLVQRLLKFPRHLSQHVGGYVLTQGRLDGMVPIHNAAMPDRTFIEWDKDDIECLGLMKVDILALGMLTCIRKAFDLMSRLNVADPELDTIATAEDPEVYAMLQTGDSIGIFQVESRAQINMLPRLKPVRLYDLVVQVAIVRPGPIEGDMVHPYLRRRAGKETPEYPSPSPEHGHKDELRELLKDTYGVPLFQEQAMKLAIVAAQFTPEEANQLRQAMQTFKRTEGMHNFEHKLIEGMVRRGYKRDFAERCYKQIEGFGSYGFPESHALSFARLVYVSAWLKCFYPAIFACAILNSQPMGFYAPAQLVRDAQEHGVVVLGVDVNASGWDNALEPVDTPLVPATAGRAPNKLPPPRDGVGWDPAVRRDGHFALRLGFRQIDGFRQDWATLIAEHAPYACVEDLARHLPPRALRLLADADALRSIGHGRREGGWEVRRTPPKQLPLFAFADAPELAPEPAAKLPAMPMSEEVAADYQATRLSLKDHPLTFLRPVFAAEGILTSAEADSAKNGRRAAVAGVVLVRQRPGKGNAIFITIEDETGITNALLWARDFEANRRAVMAARLLVLHGTIQRSEEGVVHLMTTRVEDRSDELRRLSSDYHPTIQLSRADEFVHPQHPRGRSDEVVAGKIPRSRDNRYAEPKGVTRPISPRPPAPQPSPPAPRPTHPRDAHPLRRLTPPSRDFH